MNSNQYESQYLGNNKSQKQFLMPSKRNYNSHSVSVNQRNEQKFNRSKKNDTNYSFNQNVYDSGTNQEYRQKTRKSQMMQENEYKFQKSKIQYNNDNLKEENMMLKKELKKLRKMEAGWFGKKKGKNQEIEEVIIHNNYYINKNKNLNQDLKMLNSQLIQLKKENTTLRQSLHQAKENRQNISQQTLEQEKQKIKTEIMFEQSRTQKEQQIYYEEMIQTLKREMNDLQRQNTGYQNMISKQKSSLIEVKQNVENNNSSQIFFEKSNRKLKNQKNDLDYQLKEKSVQLKNIIQLNEDLREKIMFLENQQTEHSCDFYHQGNEDQIAETDKIIQMYKNKMNEKSLENEKIKSLNEELKNEIHKISLKQKNFNVHNQISVNQNYNGNVSAMEIENETLKMNLETMQIELSKYKELFQKNKNIINKQEIEIVKEIHNGSVYGLNGRDVEDMACQNVLQQIYLNDLVNIKNQNTSKSVNFDQFRIN